MHDVAELWKYHPALVASTVTGVGGWLVAAFVSSMPALPANAGFWTRTFYTFAHSVAARLDKLRSNP